MKQNKLANQTCFQNSYKVYHFLQKDIYGLISNSRRFSTQITEFIALVSGESSGNKRKIAETGIYGRRVGIQMAPLVLSWSFRRFQSLALFNYL